MNTFKTLICGLAVVAASTAQAQSTVESSTSGSLSQPIPAHSRNFDKIQKNYLLCLNSDNAGVVESALGNVTYMRIAYPKLDLREFEGKLLDLTMNGYTRPIRRKAFMALKVFANPSIFAGAVTAEQVSEDSLFETIAGRMVR